MRGFSVSLTIVVFTLLLVSVSSAQISNLVGPGLISYNGTLNLGLTDHAQETSPTYHATAGVGAAGKKKTDAPQRIDPIVGGTGDIHPNVWITQVNFDPSHPPQNYRIIGSQKQDPFSVSFSYITSDPVDIELYINGQLVFSDCSWSGGQGYCYGEIPVNSGKFVVNIYDSYLFGNELSPPINIFLDDYPHPDPCEKTQTGHGTGEPIDVVTGQLWYEYNDFRMSGPFGLSFSRWYDNQSNFTGDLGVGWRHNYDAYLDLSAASQGIAVLQDQQDNPSWFCIVAPGAAPFYDNFTGASLGLSADGSVYTLTTWHGMVEKFDSSGRLTSVSDRVGNTQTIARDAGHNNRISSVTDTLGRSLGFGYDGSNRITSVTSTPSAISLGLTYDASCGAGNLCSVTESDGNTWTYQYTDVSPHNLTKVIDPLGNTVETNTYHGNKLASQNTGTGENSLSFNYASQSQTIVTDGLGRTTTFTIDPYLLLVTSINGPLCNCGGGEMRSFTYDSFLRKTSQTDGDGSTHTISWLYGNDVVSLNPDGSQYIVTAYPEATQLTEPLSNGLNRVTTFTYYPIGDPRHDLANVITVPSVDTPGNSKTTTNTYNLQGLLTSRSVRGYVGGNSTTYTTGFSYDSKGRLLQFTGPRTDLLQKTTYGYFPDTDSDLARRGQLSTVTNALNHVTAYASDTSPYNSYTLYGEAKSVTDPNGVVTDMTYDPRGRLLSRTIKGVPGDTTPLTTSLTYDMAGKITGVTKPLLNGLNFDYNASNRLTDVVRFAATTNNQEERAHFSYDIMSERTSQQLQACTVPSVSCASWTTTQSDTYQYDSYDRLAEVDHPIPAGSKIVYGYDGAGNLASVQDENHGSANATYAYDYGNRIISLVQTLAGAPGGQIATAIGYDIQDNPNSGTDPNGNVTAYSFDDFGRVRLETSPVSGANTRAYDPADNLLTFTDANGATTTSTYDALNRVLSAVSTRPGVPPETVSWTYDDAASGHFGIGRIATMTDPSGSVSYTYERRGLLKSEARVILGNAYSLAYGYDGNGNRNSVTYPDGKIVTYAFDWADRPLSAVSGPTTFVSSASYEPFGPLTQLAFGNGATQNTTYDLRYRPLENKLVRGGSLADYVYAEDSVGNITQIHDALNAGYNRDLGYDDLNRLITANSGSLLWGNSGNGYTYDSMGNIKTLKLGSELASFAYSGTLPLLTSVTESGKPHAGPRGVNYDPVGNEFSVGPPGGEGSPTVPYLYAPRNLLAAGDGFQYTYDGRGIRTVTSASGGGARYSFYGPELNLLSESAITGSGRPAIAFDYVWFAGRPVAEVDSIGTDWTFTDHLGTPLIQTNTSGAISFQAEYEPFGKIFALRAGDVHQPLRFPGQVAEQFDLGANGATERSYNLFRWYRPGWGRYTQPDPLSKQVSVWQDSRYSSALYGYAASNPLFFTDVTGLCTECDDCPGGEWYYIGSGFSAGIGIVGGSFSRGTYFCLSRPFVVPVKSRCLTTSGLEIKVGASACFNTSIPVLLPGSRSCNTPGLLKPPTGFSLDVPAYDAIGGGISISPGETPGQSSGTIDICLGLEVDPGGPKPRGGSINGQGCAKSFDY